MFRQNPDIVSMSSWGFNNSLFCWRSPSIFDKHSSGEDHRRSRCEYQHSFRIFNSHRKRVNKKNSSILIKGEMTIYIYIYMYRYYVHIYIYINMTMIQEVGKRPETNGRRATAMWGSNTSHHFSNSNLPSGKRT